MRTRPVSVIRPMGWTSDLLATFLCGLALICATPALAQGTTRTAPKTLLIDEPLSRDPVRIVRVMEGATEVKADGSRFPNKYVWQGVIDKAGDDWFKDLSFVVKNVSEKKIVYIAAGCALYETADWQVELAKHATTPLVGHVSNTVGRRPDQALYSGLLGHRLRPDLAATPFELAPSQEFSMTLENADDYAALRSRVEEKQPLSSVNACSGSISQIFFEDGTQWQGHRYLRADPARPGHWIKMSFEEWSTPAKN